MTKTPKAALKKSSKSVRLSANPTPSESLIQGRIKFKTCSNDFSLFF